MAGQCQHKHGHQLTGPHRHNIFHVACPAADSLPAGLKRGDELVGTMKLISKEDVPSFNVTYHVSYDKKSDAGKSSPAGGSGATPANINEALRDVRISWLSK